MDRPDELGSLKTGDWGRIQELADRFEQTWQQAQATGTSTVDFSKLLPGTSDPMRRAVLYELIKIDMEFRWRRGQIITLDHYLETYPELGPAENLSPLLIYEEYRLSQLHGVNTPLKVYQKRFPKQFAELEKLLQESNQQTRVPEPPPSASPALVAPLSASSAPPSASSAPGSGLASPNPLGAQHDAGMMVGGGYRLEKRIGSGAFGEVWRATAPGGVEVAVKIIFRPLDNEEAKTELQAMELIKTLRHPFLLQTHSFWPEQDRLLIVMELADGSLRDRLKQCRKLGLTGVPVKELITYFHQAAEALDYLHGKRLLHRDIKPDNILLSGQYAKVADFGLARLMSTRRSAKVSGSGTPAYMAPEMWASQVNQFSDQYCLATSYAELRVGRPLFQGLDIIQLMRAHLQDTPDLTGLPPKEREVLLCALAKDPLKRFKTCGDFLEALEAVVETGKVVRRDLSHIQAGVVDKQVPAPHPGLVHDQWMDHAGTVRPGSTGTPFPAPPGELQPGAPPGTDTDSHNLPTMAGASEHALGLSSQPGRETATPPRPPSSRAPSWKETNVPAPLPTGSDPSAEASARKDKKRASQGGRKALLLGAGAVLAVLALVGFLFWNAGSNLKADTAKLAAEGKSSKALADIDQAGFWTLSFARADARAQVHDIWLGQVRRFQTTENFDQLEKAAGDMLQGFPNDDEAAELLDTALRHTIPRETAQGHFLAAFQRLTAASSKSKEKQKLLDEVHGNWLAKAQKELTDNAFSRAQATALAILSSFQNDPEADRICRSARFGTVAMEVRKLKENQKYDAAFARLDEEARDLPPDDARQLRQEVDEDRSGKFKDQLAKAEADLSGQKIDLCFDDLTAAEKLARGDKELAQVSKLRIAAGIGRLAPLLQTADQQFKKGEFADCQQTLRQGLDKLKAVKPQARKDVEQELNTLLVLAWAKDGHRGEQQSADIQGRFTRLFEQGGNPRLAELAKAYVKIARENDSWRGQAQLLRVVAANLTAVDKNTVEKEIDKWKTPPPPAFAEQLAKAKALFDKNDYHGCLEQLRFDVNLLADPADRFQYLALNALSATALGQENAGRLLRSALDKGVTVRPDELTLALAKIALDKPEERTRSVETLDKVLPGIPKTINRDRAEAYVAYLNGVAEREAGKLEEAADAMVRAYAVDYEPLLTPARAQQGAEILRAAAESIPAGTGLLSPFKTPGDADKAYQWLNKARQLLARAQQELPVAARLKLALAANSKTQPDHALARQLADQLVAKQGVANLGGAALSLLVVRAQSQDTPEAALVAYGAILKQIKKADRDAVPAQDWFSSILQPAVKLGDNLPDQMQKPADVKTALAKCYAAYARYVKEHVYEDDLVNANPKQIACDYYGKAVLLDGSKPEYWIGYAYSQTALPKVDWSKVATDAQKALELSPQNSAAHGLLGYVYLLQSRRDGATDRQKQLAELRQADQALDQALKLAKKDEEDKATMLLNRSITDLELGNYIDQKEERQKYLYAARDYAAEASKLPHPYPEWVQEAWGNALEDIGMFLGDKASYKEAVDRFSNAITRRQYVARPWVSRGRTEYRWVVKGGNQDPKILDSALRDLVQATKLSKLSRDGAEAYYWEGMVYQERGKYAEARKAFNLAIDVGAKYNGRDWATLARQQYLTTTVAAARALLSTKPDESIKQADDAAQVVQQNKQDFEPKEAARLLIDIYRLKANAGLQQASQNKGKVQAKALEAVEAAAAKIEDNGDPAQAALVRGLAFEAQGDKQYPQAIEAYEQGLKAEPQKDNAVRGLLLINRASLQVRTGADVPRAQILKNLEQAAKLVPEAEHKASALALACLLNTLETTRGGVENPQDYRTAAIEAARIAIKYAATTHPDYAGVRFLLANNLFFLAKETTDDKMKLGYLNEALQRAREASRMENTMAPDDRTALRNIMGELQEEKKQVESRLSQGGQ